MEIFGYAATILMGITLGVLGGGGSILTVPILVFLFGINPIIATTYSLFLVGISSAIGSTSYFKNDLIDVKTVFYFGIPSVISVFLTKKFLLPQIPEILFSIGNFIISKEAFLLLLFAILMILASRKMIQKTTISTENTAKKIQTSRIVFQGLSVGFVTGLIGAGGGFLIIPALVNFMKLTMKKAIGTSLVLIAINSLFGFYFGSDFKSTDWNLLLTLLGFALIGIFIGTRISSKLNSDQLKPIFGWFILIMGLFIIGKELL